MKTILSPEKGGSAEERILSEGIREMTHTNHDETNTTDGMEFLDDAIRMKDQPLEEIKREKK